MPDSELSQDETYEFAINFRMQVLQKAFDEPDLEINTSRIVQMARERRCQRASFLALSLIGLTTLLLGAVNLVGDGGQITTAQIGPNSSSGAHDVSLAGVAANAFKVPVKPNDSDPMHLVSGDLPSGSFNLTARYAVPIKDCSDYGGGVISGGQDIRLTCSAKLLTNGMDALVWSAIAFGEEATLSQIDVRREDGLWLQLVASYGGPRNTAIEDSLKNGVINLTGIACERGVDDSAVDWCP